MNFKKLAFAVALGWLPVFVQAHTHLQHSMPQADSSGAAPEHIMLEFNEATQLTALTVQKEGGGDAQKIGPLPGTPEKTIHVAAPKLEPGTYVLTWRAVGDDKHIMSGTVRFTVVAK